MLAEDIITAVYVEMVRPCFRKDNNDIMLYICGLWNAGCYILRQVTVRGLKCQRFEKSALKLGRWKLRSKLVMIVLCEFSRYDYWSLHKAKFTFRVFGHEEFSPSSDYDEIVEGSSAPETRWGGYCKEVNFRQYIVLNNCAMCAVVNCV